MARRRRKIEEINAGSMADIAFLLLIFFLVSTTMGTDTGIIRTLPPLPDKNSENEKLIEVEERNVFMVLVNKNNQLLVEGQLMDIKDLCNAAKKFIENPENDPLLPSKETIDVPFFGQVAVTTKHVISLQSDRGTSFEMYIAVQNELAKAYNELRDELTLKKWGLKFEILNTKSNQDKVAAVKTIYNRKISEAEPKNTGGQK